jgi:RimJ/RimL family protein N-acetyltransferase
VIMLPTPAILIEAPMPIRTSRLLIRPKQPGDGAASLAAVTETWEDLHRWMHWADRLEEFTVEQQEARCRNNIASFLLREELNLLGIELASGQPVIWCSFYDLDWTARQCNTGYWVRRRAQGKGIATEAANAMVRYAFGALGMRRVGLTHSSGNEASRRIAEKLGFTWEGIQHAANVLAGGRVADRCCYARSDTAGLPHLDVNWGTR